MTKTRFIELQNEIARLQEIDNQHTERVDAEFKEQAKVAEELTEDEWCHYSGMPSPEAYQIECSAALDNEWANESI